MYPLARIIISASIAIFSTPVNASELESELVGVLNSACERVKAADNNLLTCRFMEVKGDGVFSFIDKKDIRYSQDMSLRRMILKEELGRSGGGDLMEYPTVELDCVPLSACIYGVSLQFINRENAEEAHALLNKLSAIYTPECPASGPAKARIAELEIKFESEAKKNETLIYAGSTGAMRLLRNPPARPVSPNVVPTRTGRSRLTQLQADQRERRADIDFLETCLEPTSHSTKNEDN